MLNTWERCPLQAKFLHLDRLPEPTGSKAAWGTCLHHALEQYNRTGDVETAVKAFLESWDNPEQLGLNIEVWNKGSQFGSMRQRGVDILKEYHERLRFESRQVIAVEHKFLVPFGEHEISGIVDLLELRNNHKGKQVLRVCDYKSQSRRPTYTALNLNLQMSFYVYATYQPEFWTGVASEPDRPGIPNGEWWYEMLADTPRRAIWIHLQDSSKEFDAGDRDDADFQRVYRLCCEIAHAIEVGVFIPNISFDSCGICAFAENQCPMPIPAPRAVQIEEEHSWA